MNIGGVHSLILQGFEEKVYEELRNLGDEVLLHTVTDLLYDREHVSSSYISSNSVIEDRLGSIVSMLTVYGIAVEGTRHTLYIESLDDTLGSKKPFPLIITPKRMARTRSEIFQRIYELLTAIHTLGSEERLFFNWNYSGLIRETDMLEESIASRLVGRRNLDVEEELKNLIREYLDELAGNIEGNIPHVNIRESLKYLVNLLPRTYNDLFERIASMKIFAEERFDDIIDYTVLVVEGSVFKMLLSILLRKAEKEGIDVFWVTSNPDDNYISRANPILSWINDTVVLTYIWKNLDQAVLRVEDVVGENFNSKERQSEIHDLPIPYKRMYTGRHAARESVSVGESIEETSGGLWYAKFSRHGPIIQLLYPREYKNDVVEEGLRELFTVSDKRAGYPRPLALVRRACKISDQLARGLGDSLLRRVDNPLLKIMLNRRTTPSEDTLE